MIPWIAFLIPLSFGLMNLVDKYAISRKVKSPVGFIVLTGCCSLFLALLVSFFLDWSKISLEQLIPPIIVGIIFSLDTYVYYRILQKEDASSFIGLLFSYPLFVSIFAYFFFSEKLSPLVYLGLLLTVFGAVLISIRMHKFKLGISIWFLISSILISVAYDIFIKFSTTNLTGFQGTVLTNGVMGLVLASMLIFPKIRRKFKFEMKNYRWAILAQILFFLAITFVYLAMSMNPVTIVVSIEATQPILLLFMERAVEYKIGRISKDHYLLPKLVAISLIVLGVILVSLG